MAKNFAHQSPISAPLFIIWRLDIKHLAPWQTRAAIEEHLLELSHSRSPSPDGRGGGNNKRSRGESGRRAFAASVLHSFYPCPGQPRSLIQLAGMLTPSHRIQLIERMIESSVLGAIHNACLRDSTTVSNNLFEDFLSYALTPNVCTDLTYLLATGRSRLARARTRR